ncbi:MULTISPECIES: type II toxin-antitoxin system VapC family toxin [Marinobacter]|uniref:type II toxin-antitoxin system VapC family toxin n=1 Tax=Marinobacter TaxID=2742 RepID=UPI003B43A30C|nr:type II toxin-antitoxin system VapC family toxin [Marinobacter alkaliphilus]
MSGRYLLDTNAIIYALGRNLKLPPAHYAVSVITKMELLSWPALTANDEVKLREVIERITVVQLLPAIQETAVKIRRNTLLKLPDAIISSTAIKGDFVLVTDDEKLSSRHVGTAISLNELIAVAPDQM